MKALNSKKSALTPVQKKNMPIEPQVDKKIYTLQGFDESINYGKYFNGILDELKPVSLTLIAKQNGLDKPKEKDLEVIATDILLEVACELGRNLINLNKHCYLFNGSYWEIIEEKDLKTFLSIARVKLGISNIISGRVHDAADNIFKQFYSLASFYYKKSNEQITKINLLNGTLEIGPNGVKFREFCKDDFLTYQLDFQYDISAKAPLFMKFLEKVLPEKEKRDIASEFFGSIFIKTSFLRLEKMLILFGKGANGKSVLLNIIAALFGRKLVSNITLENLSKDEYYRAKLLGKLVNIGNEISNSINPYNVKILASGDPIMARTIYEEPFELSDYCKFIFSTNDMSLKGENTNGFYRRLMILEFNQTIPSEEQDPELGNKIIESELPGVLNWIIEGARRVIENKKYSDSPLLEEALKKYQSKIDVVGQFIDDNNYVKSLKTNKKMKDLQVELNEYCRTNNYPLVNSITFKEQLIAKYFTVKKTNTGLNVNIETENSNLSSQLSLLSPKADKSDESDESDV